MKDPRSICNCGKCPWCRFLKANRAAIEANLPTTGASVKPVDSAGPVVDCRRCKHFSEDELPIADRKRLSLDMAKVWHDCEAGHGPICLCRVSRRCPDFLPTD